MNVGRGTYVDGPWRVADYGPHTITIGSYCSIAAEVEWLPGGMHVMDRVSTFPFQKVNLPGHDAYNRGDIIVGNDVWIGRGARIIGGARIGNGAIVGAYAVVAGVVPPYHVAVGNPARCHPRRTHQPYVDILERIAWWEWHETDPRLHDVAVLPLDDFCRKYG